MPAKETTKKARATMLPRLTFVNFNYGSNTWQRIKGICFAVGYPLFFWFLFLVVYPLSGYVYPSLHETLKGYGLAYKPAVEMTKQFIYTLKLLITKAELMRGDAVPNDLDIYTIKGEKKKLNSIMDPEQLTILNFGSCTCPIYMGRSAQFYLMTTRYKDNKSIKFINCYVPEAHPIDEWKILNKREITQQKTIDERIQSLKWLVEDIEERVNELNDSKVTWSPDHIEWIADSMDAPNLDFYFNARPIRMCIVKGGVVVHKGGYGPWFYDVQDIEDFIKDYLK